MISVIIPAYNEAANVSLAGERISRLLSEAAIAHELIFVNDGSADDTWTNILEVNAKNHNIRGISFSRNFGKDAAIFAGLAYAHGDCCAVIDCDLQHPPEKLLEMYRLWEDGFEVIEGVKTDRGDEPPAYTLFAKLFYRIISCASGINMQSSSDFRLLDRKAVDVLLRMQETSAFFRALSSWAGFRTTSIDFRVEKRVAGVSKWSAMSLIKYAVRNIVAFSTAPLQIVTVLGCITLLASLVLSVVTLWQKISGVALEGFTTVIIVQLFTGSVIMVSLGIIGGYLSQLLDEIKARPRYVVSETCGTDPC